MRVSPPDELDGELGLEVVWEGRDGLQQLSLSLRVFYLLTGEAAVTSLVTQ